jgi:hypothetical protein
VVSRPQAVHGHHGERRDHSTLLRSESWLDLRDVLEALVVRDDDRLGRDDPSLPSLDPKRRHARCHSDRRDDRTDLEGCRRRTGKTGGETAQPEKRRE